MARVEDEDLPPLPEAAPGRWRHYKGGHYLVTGVARHSETLEPLVVYRPLRDDGTPGDWWVRPHAMFCGTVTVDGRTVPRFERVGDDPRTPGPPGHSHEETPR